MYASIKDFENDWAYESKATIKVFSCLTDKSLNQKVSEKGRSIGRLAWHLVITIGEMCHKAGLKFDAPEENAPVPSKADEIKNQYSKISPAMLIALKDQWKDLELNDEVNMYGQSWKKKDVLNALVHHQIHHRGQITVLMRQAGLKVPGIYGPAREEWEQMGMTPME
jgi:uncharacterized damage-inducible protein DinB